MVYRKHHKKLKVECPRSFHEVDVLRLLDGVRVDTLPPWASPPPERTIQIFLASSSELRDDRDAFDLHFRQKTGQLRRRGVYLEIVRWEHFLDAMSATRLQDEYNKKVRACDIFVSLFFTKTGAFTEEEFDVAYSRFKAAAKPNIYTYFKNADVKSGGLRQDDWKSLWAFQEKLRQLGHFPTEYEHIEGLLLHFSDQLERFLDSLH